jgi:hypothetical protein
MKRITVILAFLICITFSAVCAQQNQTESLTVTTYYPAPYGVYKTMRLFPQFSFPQSSFTPGDDCPQEGEVFYRADRQDVFICQGTPSSRKWSFMGSVMRVFSDFDVFPDQCNGTIVGTAGNQLCSGLWYKNITFSGTFGTTPHVIVMVQNISEVTNSSCANGDSDMVVAYPGNITPTGFQVWAGGSPLKDSACGSAYETYYTRSRVGWLAVSE